MVSRSKVLLTMLFVGYFGISSALIWTSTKLFLKVQTHPKKDNVKKSRYQLLLLSSCVPCSAFQVSLSLRSGLLTPERLGTLPTSSLVRGGIKGDCSSKPCSLLKSTLGRTWPCGLGGEAEPGSLTASSRIEEGREKRRNWTCLGCGGV